MECDRSIGLFINATAKRHFLRRGIVMTRPAWPAADDFQRFITGIDQAVGQFPIDHMDAARAHFLAPRRSTFIHQHQQTTAGLSDIDFIAFAVLMPMSARHAAFAVDRHRI